MKSAPIWIFGLLFLLLAGSAHAQTAVYNCTFDSTSCGFDLAPAGGVLNVTSTTSLNWNASDYTWSNVTAWVNCPTGGNGNKLHIANAASDWLLDGTSWKNEPSYSISKGTQTLDAFVFNNWVTNHTANTSIVCIAGSCSSAGAFAINPATDTLQIETTYAGGKCVYENMTIYVLDSEAPVGGGGGGNATWNQTYPLLNASETGFWSGNTSMNRSDFYDKLIRDQQANGNVSYILNGALFVPYFTTSSSCTVADLQNGSNCNIGVTVDATHACMVNDEFSQVGIEVSLGTNETLMEAAYNTTVTTRSTRGTIPAWKVWRNGTTIEVCTVTNTNCDTASDATARTIIMLYNAANNTAFSTGNRTKYRTLADQMAADMLQYEVAQVCHPSALGMGQICYWLAGGSVVKSSGLGAGYYTYTGYFPDAQQAFGMAFASTGNLTYAAVAGNLSLNYLQAAYIPGTNWTTSVRAPPGKAFHWVNTSTAPAAVCDDTCSPDQWDAYDASRALGYCQANYWMRRIGINNTAQETYCANLGSLHFNSSTSTPLQLYPNGTNSAAYQSGYHAQGQAALFQMGGANQSLFQPTIDSALSHYTAATKTFDSEACFGVFTKAYAIRALGEGIGRNLASWPANVTGSGGGSSPSLTLNTVQFLQNPVRTNDDAICQANTTYSGSEANLTFSYTLTVDGVLINSGSTVADPNTLVNISTIDHSTLTRYSNLTCNVSATDGFQSSGTTSYSVNVSGAIPVLQTAIITAQNYLLNCSYTATDTENDTNSAAYYQYFVNGTSNATTQTLNVSSYADNTTVICQIIVADTDGNSTPLNTSTYTVGDVTAPTISNVTIPTLGSITDVLQISATIQDDRVLGQGTPVVQFTDPNGQILGNFTMSNSTPTRWYLNYTFNTVGTYTNFKIYATDGSANTATYAGSDTLAISLPGSSPAGGGGGFTPSSGPDACMFSVVQPVNGYLNPLCPQGQQSGSFTVTLFNDQESAQNYQSSFVGTDCRISEGNFTIQPKTTKTLTISGCSCPATGDAVKGQLVVKNAACGTTIPINLYSNFFSRLIHDDSVLVKAVIGFAAVMTLLIILFVLLRNL